MKFKPGDLVEIHSDGGPKFDLKAGIYVTKIINGYKTDVVCKVELTEEIIKGFKSSALKSIYKSRNHYMEFKIFIKPYIDKEINFMESDPEYESMII